MTVYPSAEEPPSAGSDTTDYAFPSLPLPTGVRRDRRSRRGTPTRRTGEGFRWSPGTLVSYPGLIPDTLPPLVLSFTSPSIRGLLFLAGYGPRGSISVTSMLGAGLSCILTFPVRVSVFPWDTTVSLQASLTPRRRRTHTDVHTQTYTHRHYLVSGAHAHTPTLPRLRYTYTHTQTRPRLRRTRTHGHCCP